MAFSKYKIGFVKCKIGNENYLHTQYATGKTKLKHLQLLEKLRGETYFRVLF